MSRICVKNLPKYASEQRLREFFSQKGEITDAKLMRTKDGKSRQFAFIGFRTEQEAEEALKFFNNAYMDTSKITCEIARKVGDPSIPRPWSRYSTKEDSSLNETKKKMTGERPDNLQKGPAPDKNIAGKSKSIENNDPVLEEFLQLMQSRAKSKIWADDTVTAAQQNKDDNGNHEEAQNLKIKEKQSNEESVPVLKSSSSSALKECSETNLTKESDEVVCNDDISDMDYFRSRIKKNWSDSESDGEDSDDEEHEGVKNTDADLRPNDKSVDKLDEAKIHGESWHSEPKAQASFERSDVEENGTQDTNTLTSEDKKDFETGRLFIRNLPYTANEDDLLELFGQFGDVSEVHLVVDKDTKRSKGIAYVLYKSPEFAARAFEELDKSIFQGRLLHIMPAKPPKTISEKPESDIGQDRKSFKQQREEQKKASEASGDTRAWNSLFIRPDTVVENIARKHGISKGDLLEREANDLAVRIALGETQVVAETKKYLFSAGVNITSLEELASKKKDNIKRSNHILLVKNLPYGSTDRELVNMFGRFGSVEKIILPPTKALALVIFVEAAEARAAFKGLAYKRYKDAPLYLEWAPVDILCPSQKLEQDEPNSNVSEESNKSGLLEQTLGGILEDDVDPDRNESRSLFVKNLNFKTSDESLRKHFSVHIKRGSIKSVKVQKHIKHGKNLSMGFGFIEFDSVETATNICKELQGTILDGHALNLQLCQVRKDGHISKKNKKNLSSTKLLVRNVAFEATEKELRQLFTPFGQIKSLRLPKKFGNHRGFAFVEFVTKQEAQNALQALSSTHFYGRHLVLEQAKEGETLEELRERTAAQFVDAQSGFEKLSRKRKHLNSLDQGSVKSAKV